MLTTSADDEPSPLPGGTSENIDTTRLGHGVEHRLRQAQPALPVAGNIAANLFEIE
jgi:hypothetical protein